MHGLVGDGAVPFGREDAAMTRLEAVLRLSVLQTELRQLADGLDGDDAKVTNYAANVLNLLRATPVVAEGGGLRLIVGGRASSGGRRSR